MTKRIEALQTKLLAHEKFEPAFIKYLEHIVAWRKSLGIINSVSSNTGQHIVNYILYLHYTSDLGDPASWCTFTNILALCVRRGQCGDRKLRTILGVLILSGMIRSKRHPADKRVIVFLPTERLQKSMRLHLSKTLACLDTLLSTQDYQNLALQDEFFISKLMKTSGRKVIEEDIMIIEQFKNLNEVLDLKGGCPVICLLSHEYLNKRPRPSNREIAKIFCISSNQVKNVIDHAIRLKLISFDGSCLEDWSNVAADQRKLLAFELALYSIYTLEIEDRLNGELRAALLQ